MDHSLIKVGDRVWVKDRFGKRLRNVVRLTPAFIILDGHSEYAKFYRKNGRQYGRWRYDYIEFVATSKEAEAWDAKEAAGKKAAADEKESYRLQEELRQSLSALFPEPIWVSDDHKDAVKGQTFEIKNLTEAEVRRIAAMF